MLLYVILRTISSSRILLRELYSTISCTRLHTVHTAVGYYTHMLRFTEAMLHYLAVRCRSTVQIQGTGDNPHVRTSVYKVVTRPELLASNLHWNFAFAKSCSRIPVHDVRAQVQCHWSQSEEVVE